MNQQPKLRVHLLASVLALALVPAACKSTEGHDRAAQTADQVVSLGHVSGQSQLHLDNSLNALEKITVTAEQNPKPAFDMFAKELEAFGDTTQQLTKQRATLKTKAEAWFADFQIKGETIQDEELRKASADRLAAFREQVAQVSSQVDGLMAGTSSLQTRLMDLRTFLGADLTAKGIGSVSSRITDSVKDGRKVAADLGRLSKASEDISNSMRAARSTPPAAVPPPAK
jgi:hypothetical protein